jgi:hypothetical protein
MKINLSRFVLLAVAAVLLNAGAAFAADTTPPEKAVPGSPAQTDTKTQENDPNGPATQTTDHPKEGTKKKKHKTHTDATQTQAGTDKATKTPQEGSAPSTNAP